MNRWTERHVVVVVDDEPNVLSAIKRSLKTEPYQVLATEKPAQALQWVESRDVSAVIADQRMPDMSGTELLDRIRDRHPATARIILTGYPGPTARTPDLPRSVDTIIGKPWDDRMLRRAIREFLSEREWE